MTMKTRTLAEFSFHYSQGDAYKNNLITKASVGVYIKNRTQEEINNLLKDNPYKTGNVLPWSKMVFTITLWGQNVGYINNIHNHLENKLCELKLEVIEKQLFKMINYSSINNLFLKSIATDYYYKILYQEMLRDDDFSILFDKEKSISDFYSRRIGDEIITTLEESLRVIL